MGAGSQIGAPTIRPLRSETGSVKLRFYLADQNPLRDRSRGITAYSDGLLAQLRRVPSLEISALISASSYRPAQTMEGGSEIRSYALPFRSDHIAGRLGSDHLHPLLAALQRGPEGETAPEAPDLWHFPKGFLPAFAHPGAPLVGTVHDTILAK